MEDKSKGRLAAFTSGSLMGLVSIFVNRLSFLPTQTIVSLRGIFGFFVLLILILSMKKGYYLSAMLKKFALFIFLIGLSASFTIFFYFKSIQMTNPGTAAFLLYTGPVWAVIFMWLFLKRVPKREDILSFIIAVIGIAFLTEPWTIDINDYARSNLYFGLFYGILSGLCLGIYNTLKIQFFSQWENSKNSTKLGNMNVVMISMAALVCLVNFFTFAYPGVKYYDDLGSNDWVAALLMGIIPTALAFSLINYGLQKDYAGDVIIFSYSEPVVGSIITAFQNDIMPWNLLLGGILIIFANLLIVMKKRIRKRIKQCNVAQ